MSGNLHRKTVLWASTLLWLMAPQPTIQSADLYWDANGNDPGTGGTANWSAGNRWRLGGPGGSLQQWANGNDAYFGGVAGTVTMNQDVSPGTSFFLVTGYTLSANANTRIHNGDIFLSAAVDLGLLDPNATDSRTIRLGGSIGGAAGSAIRIQGNQDADSAARIDMDLAWETVSVPVNIESTGTGLAGFVANADGVRLEGTITNNGSSRTMLGATAGNSLVLASGASVTGSASLQFSAGQAGEGAGLVTVDGTLAHSGDTVLDHAFTGVVRVGSDDRLSPASRLAFENGTLDLNGTRQTVAGLSGAGGRGIVNTSASPAELVIDLAGGTENFGAGIGVPADNANLVGANSDISLTKRGAGAQILSGSHGYTGSTRVEAGILALESGSSRNPIGESSEIRIDAGATLDVTGIGTPGGFLLRDGQTLSGNGTVAGDVSLESGATVGAGGAGSIGSLGFTGDLEANGGSLWLVDIVAASNGQSDHVSVAGMLDLGGSSLQLVLLGSSTLNHSYTIASYGVLTGTFAGLADGAVIHGYRIDYGAGLDGAITLTAVPEPGSLVLLALCAALSLLMRRRREPSLA